MRGLKVNVKGVPNADRELAERLLQIVGRSVIEKYSSDASKYPGLFDLDKYPTLVTRDPDTQSQFSMHQIPHIGKDKNHGTLYPPSKVEFFEGGLAVYVAGALVGEHKTETEDEVYKLLASVEDGDGFLGYYVFRERRPGEWIVTPHKKIVFDRIGEEHKLLHEGKPAETESTVKSLPPTMKVKEICEITGLGYGTIKNKYGGAYVTGNSGVIDTWKFIGLYYENPPEKRTSRPSWKEILYGRKGFGLENEERLREYLSKEPEKKSNTQKVTSRENDKPSGFDEGLPPYERETWSYEEAEYLLGANIASLRRKYPKAFIARGTVDAHYIIKGYFRDPLGHSRTPGKERPTNKEVFDKISMGHDIEEVRGTLGVSDLFRVSRPFKPNNKYTLKGLFETELIQKFMKKTGKTEDDIRDAFSDIYSGSAYVKGRDILKEIKVLLKS